MVAQDRNGGNVGELGVNTVKVEGNTVKGKKRSGEGLKFFG